MVVKYQIGNKVIIVPVKNQHLNPRDLDLESYEGKIGEVTNYYWISPSMGEVFYIYTVLIETDRKEIVLHEDELATYIEYV
jgi:hypothetical protein